MKAIVTNVKKSSGYSQYNGLTFEVKEVLNNIIALKIPSKLDIDRLDTVDFSFNEVFIIDVELEIIKSSINSELVKYDNLLNYCKVKEIIVN